MTMKTEWMSKHEKHTWQVAVKISLGADTNPADSLFMAVEINYSW